MTAYRTKENCGCQVITGMGGKRPLKCEAHGNRYLSEKELRPLPRTDGVPTVPWPELQDGTPQKPRRRSGMKRTRRKESKAERAARNQFNATVKSWRCWFAAERPCERCDGQGETLLLGDAYWTCTTCNGDGKHHCEGRKDAHHLVPKQFLRKRFQGVLPEDQFVAILFNPLIGAPLCRKAHDRIESGADRIYWEDLTDEAVEYVFSLPDFVALRLEEESPKRPERSAAG